MKKFSLLLVLRIFLVGKIQAQIFFDAQNHLLGQDFSAGNRIVLTHVPTLLITPDAQAVGMGDVGVATNPSANDIFWNPAKMSFNESSFALNVGYNPWLRRLYNDINFYTLSGHYKLSEKHAIGLSMRYFNSTSALRNAFPLFAEKPRDIAIDVAYSRKLSKNLGIGAVVKFIHSKLYRTDPFIGGNPNNLKNANTLAFDLALFYSKPIKVAGKEAKFNWGVNIANLGPKLNYSDAEPGVKYFIPANLRIGAGFQLQMAPEHQLLLGFDLNKLLVPSLPIYDGQFNTVKGSDPNEKNVIQGVFSSFGDAPDGFSEELKEFTWSLGVEYQYKNTISLRTGTFREHQLKGNRKYYTLGLGVKIVKTVNLNASYVLGTRKGDPLAKTLRLSAGFEL